MRRPIQALAVLVWVLWAGILSLPAQTGNDFYVSAAGSDSAGNGTIASPWATIAYASTRVGPGATVHVAAGTYTGSFTTKSSGTASAYLTYVADTADFSQPVNCAQVAASQGNMSTCVHLVANTLGTTWSNNGDYVAIVGFDVTGPVQGYNGIYTQGKATKIIGNHVHGVLNSASSTCNSTGGSGINLNGPNSQVIGNYVHDNGPYLTACGYVHGIYFLQPGGIAWNNISFRNSGWGIQLWHGAAHETLVNNTLFNNLTGGIVVGSSKKADDYTAVNNNIVFKNARGIYEEGKTGTHNLYENNLVDQNAGCNDSADCNWSLQNGNAAVATVKCNPQFVKYTGDSTGNYQLQSSSPAINVGTSDNAPAYDFKGVSRPQGGAWDIGAYEFVGTPSRSTCSP